MKIVAIYDNPKFGDRYTVYFSPGRRAGNGSVMLYDCLAMSAHPFSPQGIGQHTSGQLGRHNGKRIDFSILPEDCKKLVRQELGVKEIKKNSTKFNPGKKPQAYNVLIKKEAMAVAKICGKQINARVRKLLALRPIGPGGPEYTAQGILEELIQILEKAV